MTSPDRVDWRLVVPVKGGPGAKSRLHPPHGVSRVALASAIAHDCLVAACAGMPRGEVVVVTPDAGTAGLAEELGAVVVPDPGEGLNAAVARGVAVARAHPDGGEAGSSGRVRGVAVLLGDLPALRPDDLVTALAAAQAHPRAVVPDAEGTGTVLLTALAAQALVPAFGPGSAARHESSGHTRLELPLPRLRTDVDDDRSLADAITLGVGRATRVCLGLGASTLPDMQASVHTFDDETGAGSALLDDGREVAFSGEVFGASALRRLRPGQRISIELDSAGAEITRLWIVGIGDDQRIG